MRPKGVGERRRQYWSLDSWTKKAGSYIFGTFSWFLVVYAGFWWFMVVSGGFLWFIEFIMVSGGFWWSIVGSGGFMVVPGGLLLI